MTKRSFRKAFRKALFAITLSILLIGASFEPIAFAQPDSAPGLQPSLQPAETELEVPTDPLLGEDLSPEVSEEATGAMG